MVHMKVTMVKNFMNQMKIIMWMIHVVHELEKSGNKGPNELNFFSKLLEEAKRELHEGCTTYTRLAFIMRLLDIIQTSMRQLRYRLKKEYQDKIKDLGHEDPPRPTCQNPPGPTCQKTTGPTCQEPQGPTCQNAPMSHLLERPQVPPVRTLWDFLGFFHIHILTHAHTHTYSHSHTHINTLSHSHT
jgi:hypothetical protein